jgi:hypothetical protein
MVLLADACRYVHHDGPAEDGDPDGLRAGRDGVGPFADPDRGRDRFPAGVDAGERAGRGTGAVLVSGSATHTPPSPTAITPAVRPIVMTGPGRPVAAVRRAAGYR